MKTTIIAMLLLFGEIMSSQTITYSHLTSECADNAYSKNTNCVKGWSASHGKPSVGGTIGENTWAWMWSHSNLGEGIITNYNFQAGRKYQITFRIRTSSNISNPNKRVLNSTANVRAVSGINATSTSYTTPQIPIDSEVIWSKPIKKSINKWETVSLTFNPINDNSQLWFYPLMTELANSNGGGQIQMEIDDVNITSISIDLKSDIADNNLNYLTFNSITKRN